MTIVFVPLIALMRDQVKKLQNLGIKAACINSDQKPEENNRIIEQAKKNEIKILYIAPERSSDKHWIDAIKHINISFIAIDEAHCISMWGHDFRPAFREIIDLVRLQHDKMPILATTATATTGTEKDIKEQL
jgi:ATP-dependent DNA helicase RecQ